MTAPRFASVDDTTADLLTLVADIEHPVARDVPALFLAACRRDAMVHDGIVSVNRVRELLAGDGIEHHRYSAMWSTFTGRNKPMEKTGGWLICEGSPSGNNGRPYPERRWVGAR